MIKSIGYFFNALWTGIYSAFSHLSNPNIVVCAWCKKVLHSPKNATAISHGMCWICYYKSIGGKIPTLPKLSDLSIVKAFCRPKEVHDEIWSGQTIYRGLLRNGELIKEARKEGRSLNSEERSIVGQVRSVATQMGYSKTFINATEMEGAGFFPQEL